MPLCYLHNNKNIYFICRYVDFCSILFEYALFYYFPCLCPQPWLIMPSAELGSDMPSQIFLCQCVAVALSRFSHFTMVWIYKLNKWQIARQKGRGTGAGSRVVWYLPWVRCHSSFTASWQTFLSFPASDLQIPAPAHTSVWCHSARRIISLHSLKGPYVWEHKWKDIPGSARGSYRISDIYNIYEQPT